MSCHTKSESQILCVAHIKQGLCIVVQLFLNTVTSFCVTLLLLQNFAEYLQAKWVIFLSRNQRLLNKLTYFIFTVRQTELGFRSGDCV